MGSLSVSSETVKISKTLILSKSFSYCDFNVLGGHGKRNLIECWCRKYHASFFLIKSLELIFFPFYSWENWGLERFTSLPAVTQIGRKDSQCCECGYACLKILGSFNHNKLVLNKCFFSFPGSPGVVIIESRIFGKSNTWRVIFWVEGVWREGRNQPPTTHQVRVCFWPLGFSSCLLYVECR